MLSKMRACRGAGGQGAELVGGQFPQCRLDRRQLRRERIPLVSHVLAGNVGESCTLFVDWFDLGHDRYDNRRGDEQQTPDVSGANQRHVVVYRGTRPTGGSYPHLPAEMGLADLLRAADGRVVVYLGALNTVTVIRGH